MAAVSRRIDSYAARRTTRRARRGNLRDLIFVRGLILPSRPMRRPSRLILCRPVGGKIRRNSSAAPLHSP